MGQALYRKYRSKSLIEVIGQEHITTTLTNALKNENINHAYLFVGPRGVGKTSVARILAHEVNNLKYDDETHLDIIEIDAASNRRIDEIRELRERVHNAPSSAKYKVYIIDEVHMLTREAFNALLKTLEEPPTHVIFILATTEAHKLPATIISRTQRFVFKSIHNEDVVKHLKFIAKKENISINDEALLLIAEHGGGSFRDSIGILDQARNVSKKLDVDVIQNILGLAPNEAIVSLLENVRSGDISQTIVELNILLDKGNSAGQIAKQLIDNLRQELIHADKSQNNEMIAVLMRSLLTVPTSQDIITSLQLSLIEACISANPKTESNNNDILISPKNNTTKNKSVVNEQELPITITKNDSEPVVVESLESQELWPRVLVEIKKYHNTLYSIARMAKTTTGTNNLLLEFSFPFHQKRLNEQKNKQVIIDIIYKLTGQSYVVECNVIESSDKSMQIFQKPQDPENIAAISNIFGNVEMLES